jgi:hypothetical protein
MGPRSAPRALLLACALAAHLALAVENYFDFPELAASRSQVSAARHSPDGAAAGART